MHKLISIAAAVVAAWTLTACGDDDKKEDGEPTAGAVGTGYVARAESGKVELSFADAEAGAQYVIMPYVLGDPATIQGAGEEKVSFTVATSTGEGSGLVPYGNKLSAPNLFTSPQALFASNRLSDLGRDHALRTRVNGMNRPLYQTGAAKMMTTITAGECPTDSVVAPDPADPSEAFDLDILPAVVVDKGAYCLVYVDTPVTEADKTKIEASVAEILRRYKDVVYQSQLAAVNGYTFKPVIAIIDFTDATKWSPELQIAGAFSGPMSDDTKMPMLYMPSDISKVGTFKDEGDATLLRRTWHATLAHEMQHAVMDYFRKRVSDGKGETPAIDEGFAHYMEDFFGFGGDSFNGFPASYLKAFNETEGAPAVLSAADSGATERGAAQTLLYYLISQKGGVTFAGGIPTGGDGLAFIKDAVSVNTSAGPATLTAKFGGDWVDTMGNFFGAMVIDGTALEPDAALKYTAQNPQAGAKNLLGEAKTYGMSFNGFSGVSDRLAESKYTASTAVTALEEMDFYQTSPLLYTVTDPAAKITFTPSGEFANTAVSVVRVK